MKLVKLLSLVWLTANAGWAVTANMQLVNDIGGSGVFVFTVNGQTRKLFCDQFFPNATNLPYVANVATLANLTGSFLNLQGDPQALLKYQRLAILDLRALADPTLAVDVVRAKRFIVDGAGALPPGALALYNFALAANPANYDLTAFRIYTNTTPNLDTQEVTGFEPGYVQICKVAGNGVTVGTNFSFTVAGLPVTVPAGPAPGGTCSVAVEVPAGQRAISEALPVGTTLTSLSSSPAGALTNPNLTAGTATVAVGILAQTTVTFVDAITNPTTGFIQICKVAGSGVTVGTNTTFDVGGTQVIVPAGAAPGGSCATPVAVPAGQTLITETLLPGTAITGVSTLPNGSLVNSTPGAGTATVSVTAGGQTIVTFINSVLPVDGGLIQVCKVAGSGVAPGTIFIFTVMGTPFPVPAGPSPGGTCSPALPVPAGQHVVTEALQANISVTGVSTFPEGLLVSTDLPNGSATVNVVTGGQTIVTFIDTFTGSLDPPLVATMTTPYQVRYAANLHLGDSVVNISNAGELGAGLAAGQSATTTGAICANVYVFSPDEQMVSCCSCAVTPNGLVSLSARNDLTSTPLTPAIPTAIVIKLLATVPTPGIGCTGSASTANVNNLASGMTAWGTSLHVNPGGTLAMTETPFLPATLSLGTGVNGDIGELARLTRLCGFINANGSGFGICRTCRLGGLGGGRL